MTELDTLADATPTSRPARRLSHLKQQAERQGLQAGLAPEDYVRQRQRLERCAARCGGEVAGVGSEAWLIERGVPSRGAAWCAWHDPGLVGLSRRPLAHADCPLDLHPHPVFAAHLARCPRCARP